MIYIKLYKIIFIRDLLYPVFEELGLLAVLFLANEGVMAMNKTIYLKCSNHSKVNRGKVVLKDIAEIYSADNSLKNKVSSVSIIRLQTEGERKVLSVLYVMEQIEKEIPGLTVENIGEIDVIVEWEKPAKNEVIKIAAVSLIAFFGTAFTIMAFHNDIGIRSVFEEIYYLTSGNAPEGLGLLEFSYCLGLFIGITVFFNHIGKKKLNGDPTPIAVAMHNYEKDVNQAIVENAERRGVEKDE